MTVPTIDTFEHDISQEIRTKEAGITNIASASNDIGNTAPPSTSPKILFVIGGVLIILVLTALVWGIMFYSRPSEGGETLETPAPITDNTPSLPDLSTTFAALSPTLSGAIGGNIGEVTKSEFGYTITLLSYGPVFSYMLRNESLYADELALAVAALPTTQATSSPFMFTDVTLNNQNMRVGTSGSSTVVYAFVNGKNLLISSSTEGILALRNGILAQ